jgi:hypothetical protein
MIQGECSVLPGRAILARVVDQFLRSKHVPFRVSMRSRTWFAPPTTHDSGVRPVRSHMLESKVGLASGRGSLTA